MKPLKKTPAARMWVRLRNVSMAGSNLHRSNRKMHLWKRFHPYNSAQVGTYPLPKLVYPHQNKIGSMIMKQV